jgi:hypothetical protein
MPGSPSSDPRRIATSSPSGHSPPNRLEPQTEQKAFTRPPSGLKTRISSSPEMRRKPERGTRPLRSAEGARMLSAPRAVAVIGPAEGRRHLEADTTAQARAVQRVLRARLCGHVRWTPPGHDESLDPLRITGRRAQRRACSNRGSSRTAAKSSSLRASSRNRGSSSTDRRRWANVSSPVSPASVAKHAKL